MRIRKIQYYDDILVLFINILKLSQIIKKIINVLFIPKEDNIIKKFQKLIQIKNISNFTKIYIRKK